MKPRLTRRAERDIDGILRDTLRLFGRNQLLAYATVIDKGIAMIGADPQSPLSMDRCDIRLGVRSLHLEIAAGRRGGAAHKLYFRQAQDPEGRPEIIVLRILHEGMEPRRRLLLEMRNT